MSVGDIVFINKNNDGSHNICGANISALRIEQGLSQREFADKLQLYGLDFTKNTIQRIESGQRFVTDIELVVLSKYFDLSADELLKAK